MYETAKKGHNLYINAVILSNVVNNRFCRFSYLHRS